MNELDLPFPELMARVRSGDEQAAQQLYNLVEVDVLRTIRRRLNPILRTRFDSVDFVQSAWESFFRRIEDLPDFPTAADLIRHLQAIARNKVTDEIRRNMGSGKRDFRRERGGELDYVANSVDIDIADQRQLDPNAMASAREVWHFLHCRLPNLHRMVLMMRFEGLTFVEISSRLDIHERSARKIMERICSLVESQEFA